MLRAGKQTASPIAVLAEAKKEEEKKAAPQTKAKPQAETKTEIKEEPVKEQLVYRNTVVWLDASAVMRGLGGSAEEFMDEGKGVGKILPLSKFTVSGFDSEQEPSGPPQNDLETHAFTKSYDEARINAGRGNPLALMDKETGSIYNLSDSSSSTADPVLFRVVDWQTGIGEAVRTPAWMDKHDAVLTGDYQVMSVHHLDVPEDLLDVDEERKVWVVTLQRYQKVG